MESVECGVSTQIYFEALEDNIMRNWATNYILDLFGVVLANDMADLAVNGTGGAGASFLEIN